MSIERRKLQSLQVLTKPLSLPSYNWNDLCFEPCACHLLFSNLATLKLYEFTHDPFLVFHKTPFSVNPHFFPPNCGHRKRVRREKLLQLSMFHLTSLSSWMFNVQFLMFSCGKKRLETTNKNWTAVSCLLASSSSSFLHFLSLKKKIL